MAASIDTINSINKFLVIQQLPDMRTQDMIIQRSILDYHMLMLADNRLTQIPDSLQTERTEAENERINDLEEKHRHDNIERQAEVTVKSKSEHIIDVKI